MVKSFPRTLTPSNIISFLGLAEACKQSFQEFNDRLTSTLVLTLLDGTVDFVVYYDAGIIRLGCVLMKNGDVIAYASRQLKFWKSFQKGLGTRVNLNTTFHPQTDSELERTIQILEDILRECVIVLQGSWDDHLPIIDFAYNNTYDSSIGMAPFDAFYGKRCNIQ
ncbi:hypothetical protein MTR67_039212 [Solanum verrucosum]|uniref:Reverse transcriptase/retrotransposon-derived protein RNase H-like domain-containing protein n=1 Tax=Solanum verrucosum TaxID=315347 RepID=A0AAF0ZNF0_SOLVR|nr:hypothetical protein MTR67_039212 [Solanum verrucosum]